MCLLKVTIVLHSTNLPNHFDMQELANKYNINLVHLYGIASHGKGEVYHVGGVAKIRIRREITHCKMLQIWLNSIQNFVIK